jgi:hypothetical protein
MFLSWFKKVWALLAAVVVSMLIMGPLAKPLSEVLGGVFAQPALVIDNLAAICLVLLACDFILDSRRRWGIFPTLDLDTAIDNAIKGEVDRGATDNSGKEVRRPNPIASAIVVLAAVVLLIAILFLAVPGAHAAALDASRPYLPVLSQTLDSTWPGAPMRHIPAGQVEQESGWKKTATLKTSRELGRGLVQMTIAYDSAGRERFNIYRDAVRYRALSGWDWRRDPYNVRYQLTFLVLQDRANFNQVRPYSQDDVEALKCALVCYNAGSGRWLQRLKNARIKGLPTNRWDGGLALAYGAKETALLYGRPLYLAVNEYPAVIFKRAAKYQGLV